MESKKLKFIELLSLDAEINGYYRPAQLDADGNQLSPELKIVGITNSLPQELNFILKYRLDKLVATVVAEKTAFYEMQKELAKKYGTETEGGEITIEREIDGKENPKFEKFQKENEELLQEEITISYNPLPLKSMGDIVNGQRYSILYDFIED
jgi:hypothetical protein